MVTLASATGHQQVRVRTATRMETLPGLLAKQHAAFLRDGPPSLAERAMIKPSEVMPATSDVLMSLIAETFSEDEVAVVTGDASVNAHPRQCHPWSSGHDSPFPLR